MQWTPGQRLQNGKYTITKVLSERGGFGITYLADSKEYGQVVIKTLNDTMQQQPDFHQFQTDFMNEALKIRGCQHRHIVKVHQLFQEKISPPRRGNAPADSISLVGMVMEFIAGQDLANRGRLPEPEALRYVAQVGAALEVVHKNGLVHRDVKPNNIMVRQGTDEAVLIDFGMAREFTPNVTRTHTQMVTEGYAPIEQYQLEAKRGSFTDVYALAATLYSLLTGVIPLDARNRRIAVLEGRPDIQSPQAINSAVSDRVNRAVMEGMRVNPGERPQTMAAWLRLLGNVPKIEPPVVVPPIVTPLLPLRLSELPTVRVVPPPTPIPTPSEADPPSPPEWLKRVGQGGAAMLKALLELEPENQPDRVPNPKPTPKPKPKPATPWERLTLGQKAVAVDNRGQIVRSYPVTVDVYVEDLGNGVQLRLVRIPEGRFEMGSPA
ncbi:MAG: serine/threonine protein kinase, partial [Leptolyngbyaceae cyanobacterium]